MQGRRLPISPQLILRLQTTVGNRAVLRLLERRRRPDPDPASPALLSETARRLSWWRRFLNWIRRYFMER